MSAPGVAADGPETPAIGAPRVPPTLGRGLIVAVLYAVIFLAAGLISGVDYDNVSQTASNILGFIIIPVGLGIIGTLALTWRWGWWPQLFHETRRLAWPRWQWAIPILIGCVIAVNLIAAPWDEWTGGLVVLLFVGCMLVGFGEEIVFRGYVLVGARGRYGETGAWFVSSGAFALLHGLNIITGQAVGTTVQQIASAFVIGSAFYLVRRMSGTIILGMVLHGLWDFSTFLASGRGDTAAGVPKSAFAFPFVAVTAILTIIVLVGLFRHGKDKAVQVSAPAPA